MIYLRMTRVRLAIAILFFVISFSSLIMAGYGAYITDRIERYDGRSSLVGEVVDIDGHPLYNTEVRINHMTTTTDKQGKWRMDGVMEGKVNIEFFKCGYRVVVTDWICYPISYFGDEESNLFGTPNEVREGSNPVTLQKELTLNDTYVYYNKKSNLLFNNNVTVNYVNLKYIGHNLTNVKMEIILLNGYTYNMSLSLVRGNLINLTDMIDNNSSIDDVAIYGKSFTDQLWTNISSINNCNYIDLVFISDISDNDNIYTINLKKNYYLSYWNIFLSILLIIGCFLCLSNGSSWILFIFSILGFISTGIPLFDGLSVNFILSLCLTGLIIWDMSINKLKLRKKFINSRPHRLRSH